MEQSSAVKILDAIDIAALKLQVGVKDRSIRLVRERNVFPASWYPTVQRLCEDAK